MAERLCEPIQTPEGGGTGQRVADKNPRRLPAERVASAVVLFALFAAGIPGCDRGSSPGQGGPLDQVIVAGTDIASFYLYHPEDLQHRRASPFAWTCYHFACQPEFAAGRLVAFDTGGDGGYAFRVTEGELTEREQTWLANTWDFRYVVRHGRVYLDGGYALPCADYFDDSEDNPEQWIELPNGNYKVTVNAIDWYSEPGAVDERGEITDLALPGFVIQFMPVDDLESIEVSSTPPLLESFRDVPAAPVPSFAESETFEDVGVELADSYVLLVNADAVPVPSSRISIEGTADLYEALYGARGNTLRPDRIKELVIAPRDEAPCIGVLVRPAGAGSFGNGPWQFHFSAKRLVTVNSIEPTSPWPTGQVTPLERPDSSVPSDELEALKQAFAEYAAANEDYRRAIPHPDFEAERVASMNSAEGVTHVLIHHVQMPMETRLQMLPLSDAERVERLAGILEADSH